jgi:3D (Asp-Asp-Asp) domain-containing protein
LSRIDDLNRVADQSRQVVEVTADSRLRLGSLSRTLASRRAELGAADASARQTTASLEAARSARLEFISRLRAEKSVEVARLEAAARRVERKSNSLQATATLDGATVSAPSVSPVAGRRLVVSSTGYALTGRTATGMPAGWGVVAVDPAVIPLGTRLSVPGYGEGVAADTGGAVQGATVDLWFPTLAQAHSWGRRTITITLH